MLHIILLFFFLSIADKYRHEVTSVWGFARKPNYDLFKHKILFWYSRNLRLKGVNVGGLSGISTRPKFDSYRNYTKTNGFDHRPKNTTSSNDANLFKISEFFKKKRTIDTLQNPNIPISEKMRLIDDEQYLPKATNIFAGGLMSDWEFDIDRKFND
jgi:hypothetical protein